MTIGLALIALILIWWGLSIYPDWLCFEKLNYSSVFWTMIFSKFGIGVGIWLLLMALVGLNIWVAGRSRALSRPGPTPGPGGDLLAQFGLSGKSAGYLLAGLVIVVSFVIAQKGASQWDMILRFFHQEPFGKLAQLACGSEPGKGLVSNHKI